MHLAQAHHHAGGEQIQGHLGGGASLEPGGARQQFGASEQANVDGAGHRHLLGWHAGHGDCQGSDRLGVLQGPEHVGSGAASSDAHQTIGRAKAALLQVAAASSCQILQALGAAQQGWGAASEHALHQLRRRAESWRTLGGVEHTEPAGGARP